ncbi:hypothetical protein FA13DRAFT_1748799 [Coprinellus micaceus]|uniref:Secreted protein n=1 Tax=Coprinellus micaceus TaxID=71717 RepID=A0A4Y7RQG9_COPMI|nr:hypothetical protein FA13DRAFT_1748799 [Coprinellus micaceus]
MLSHASWFLSFFRRWNIALKTFLILDSRLLYGADHGRTRNCDGSAAKIFRRFSWGRISRVKAPQQLTSTLMLRSNFACARASILAEFWPWLPTAVVRRPIGERIGRCGSSVTCCILVGKVAVREASPDERRGTYVCRGPDMPKTSRGPQELPQAGMV